MILGCFLEHKDTEENCSPNQREISVIHKTLQPLLAKRKKKENHATAGSAAFCFFLKIKKKTQKHRGGCYLAQSPVTLVLGSLWNTELFNDANYKQRENIRRVCLEISLLDWKLASLIELAGLRFFSAEACLGALVPLHYLTTQWNPWNGWKWETGKAIL